MAWKAVNVEDQRISFIKDFSKEKYNFSDLCKQYDITRRTGYKWIDRYQNKGISGLKNNPKIPINKPTKTPTSIETEILNVKYQWPKWGAKKIHGYLVNQKSDSKWPCKTTVENILKQNGLVQNRYIRKRLAKTVDPLGPCNASNDIWCIDFKGWWLTRDQHKYEPFTITDAFSRYLLCCQNLIANNSEHAWAVMEKLFREYGLPLRVRSDNGPPFASLGPKRLSRFSINLIKANVMPEWIEPGEPQQNGRHERMHLTLKSEGIDLSLTLAEQVKKLEEYREYYNFIRPHEALEQKRPSDVYVSSIREWDGKLRSPEYPSNYKVGKVHSSGKMNMWNKSIYISRVFTGEPVGLLTTETGIKAYYGPFFLGLVEDNTLSFERRNVRKRNKNLN